MEQPNFIFTRASVLVVGDLMLDRYWHGSTSRISPEAPVPVVKVDQEDSRLGGAGNVALNVATLGAKSHLLALVGTDTIADVVEDMLIQKGVSCQLQKVQGSATITKMRILSRHQQLIRLDFEDAFDNWDASVLEKDFISSLKQANAIILSDYAKGILKSCQALIKLAREANIPVIVDPKGTDFERYRGATMITPNLSEFEAVVGRCQSEEDIVQRGIALREQYDLEAVLVTRSEKGMTLLAKGQEPLHLPTRAQEVYDVTGAGDTVVATLGVALGAGLPLHEAVQLSNIAAGIVVAKLGTATVTPLELEQAVQTPSIGTKKGICTELELLQKVNLAKSVGEKIVMTNGCFDILHPGHVDYLEKARALGDKLIVAVNDDNSVKRLKGDERPMNPLGTRLTMLAALGCVDWVVSFSEDTPERIITNVLPDILVKGGDYTVDQVAGAKNVLAAGGEVKILNFLDGHSTTTLINKIRRG